MSLWVAIGIGAAVLVALAVLRGGTGPAPTRPASPEERALFEVALREAMASGRKIEAIKLYRRIHGVGLKEAKEAVERLQAEAAPPPIG